MNERRTDYPSILERLTILETKVDTDSAKIDTIYKNIVGANGQLGLNTRVTLLEESEKSRKITVNRIWTAIIGLGIGTITSLWKK